MTDELQAPEAEELDQETPEQIEGQGEVSESAAEEEKKVTFDPDQQALVNGIIGEKVKATHEAKREADELRRELEEAKSQIPQAERPAVPDLPDPFDKDFDTKVREREEAIRKQAEYDAREMARQEREDELTRQQAQQQQAQLTQVFTTYAERAKSLGISNEELQIAGNALLSQGISEDLASHILQDDKGPAITKFLADNPLAIEEMRGMNPMQAAIHIETKIKPNVGGKGVTQAPPPETTLDGGGTPPTERGPKGATFE